jgi:predicted ATPase
MIGEQLGPWRVEVLLGVGGTASVFRVRREDGVLAALKVPVGVTSERLLREGRALGQLRHPHIVELLEVLPQGLLLELVAGPSLASWLASRRTPCTPEQILGLFLPMLAALHHAHSTGWIHRDLKPANVLLSDDGPSPVPKIADFGLAHAEEDLPRLTQTGALLGTPGYMAPEQRQSPTEADARADIFSLGAMLFEICCGRPAFVGSDPLAVLHWMAQGQFPEPRHLRPDLPDALAQAISGALQPDPEQRIPDCDTLRHVMQGLVPWVVRRRQVLEATWEAPAEAPPSGEPPLGRAEALSRLEGLLSEHALVTLTGPGGVGKTTLARALLAGRPDAVLVDLSEVDTAAGLVFEVARALGLEVRTPDPEALVVRIGEVLARRPRTLLVLDTFDRALAAGPETLERWRSLAPRARFLVTCREPLELSDEVVFDLGPLALEHAVVLLQRAVTGLGALPPADEAQWRELAAALGGLPLVLELAAEATARYGPEGALQRWAERHSWLRRSGGGPVRHQTLEHLLDWSWQRLSPAEQQALAQLSVFHGGFVPEAASVVLSVPDPELVLRELRRKHLLHPTPSPHAPGAARLALLDHVKVYAEARLRERDERASTQERHAAWASSLGSPELAASLLLAGGDVRVRALLAELPNLRAAWEHALAACPQHAAGIAIAWSLALERTGPFDPAPARTALPLAQSAWQRSMLVQQQAWMAVNSGQGALAEQILTEHLASGTAGDSMRPRLLNTLGASRSIRGLHPQAEAAYQQALAAGPEHTLQRGLILRNLAAVLAASGSLSQAREGVAESERLLKEGRASELELARTRQLQAELLASEGQREQALVQLDRVQRTFRRLGLPRSEVMVAISAAGHQLELGQEEQALARLRPALQRSIELGMQAQEVNARMSMACMFEQRGESQQAVQMLQGALELARRLGTRSRIAKILHGLGALALAEGRTEEAILLLRQSLDQQPSVPARALLLRARTVAGELDVTSPEVHQLVTELEQIDLFWRDDAWVDLAWVARLSGDEGQVNTWLARAAQDADAQRLPPRAPLRRAIEELLRSR